MRNDITALIKPGLGMSVIPAISTFDYDPWNGRLLIWDPPTRGCTYVLGVDPAQGVGNDNSVCCVIKVGTHTYPDEQVAEFASNYLDPVEFSAVVNTIGRFYSEDDGTEAFCSVECNADCGDVVANTLYRRLDYTNLFQWKVYDKIKNVVSNKLGWWTNRTTRPKLIAAGIHALSYGDLIINSPYLLDEMADFKQDHMMAKAAARSGCHDDRVMALLIAYWAAHDDEWLSGEDIAEQRRLLAAAGVAQDRLQHDEAPRVKADYQNQAMSYRDMMAAADDALFGD